MLKELWREKEGFSGKRPFGNSGWENDLYEPLIKDGFIVGTLDEDGYVESVDEKAGYDFVVKLMDIIFYEE